jgi:peptide/nickel transport system ATP-binding protein
MRRNAEEQMAASAPLAAGSAAAVEDLAVRFGDVQALRGVTLDVRQGEIVGLVGESGSGKSVLGLALLGLLPANAQMRGSARLAGVDMVTADPTTRRLARRAHAGVVFQDPMSSLNPTMRVEAQIREAVADDGDVHDLLRQAGLSDPQRIGRSFPHQLSGGQRQRVMIAMAIARRPRLLVADEPTTALDVTVQAAIVTRLRDLRDELNAGIVFVTHDLALAGQLADRIGVLYAGRMLEVGPAADVLHAPSHPYTRGLLAARVTIDAPARRRLPVLDGELPSRRAELTGCAFAPRCAGAIGACTCALPELAPSPLHAGADACVRAVEERPLPAWPAAPPAAAVADDEVALELDGVSKRFGALLAVDGVGFSVRRGRCLALVGESGSGKTTTLRIAVGLLAPDAGRVVHHGDGGAQMIFQDAGSSLTPWLTVRRMLAERLRAAGVRRGAEQRRRIDEVLAAVGLPQDVLERRSAHLSGGQRQRVAIARAVVVPPAVLVCDEPTSALDVSLAATVLNLLADLRDQLGMAMLFVTHDLSAARAVADEIAVMRDGRIVERGDAEALLADPAEDYTRRLVGAVPRLAAA